MKLENTLTPNSQDINEFIDRIISALRADKKWLDFNITAVSHDMPSHIKSRLSWDLVHFQGSWLETIRNLERLQEAVNKGTDASKQI